MKFWLLDSIANAMLLVTCLVSAFKLSKLPVSLVDLIQRQEGKATHNPICCLHLIP